MLLQLSYREKICSSLTITATFLSCLTAPASLGFAVSCLVIGDRARGEMRSMLPDVLGCRGLTVTGRRDKGKHNASYHLRSLKSGFECVIVQDCSWGIY